MKPGDIVTIDMMVAETHRRKVGVNLFDHPKSLTPSGVCLWIDDFILVVAICDWSLQIQARCLVIAGNKMGWAPESWLKNV